MDYLSGWCKSSRRLDGYTAVITGSNTGIGKETARDLFARGARVILACRNVAKAESAKTDIENSCKEGGGSLKVEELNLASLKSVRDFALRVLTNELKIQILVNNAGVMMCSQSDTEDGFETHMGTNHMGHAFLTLLLIPRLIQSGPSRVINVSSYLHQNSNINLDDIHFRTTPYNALKAYCWSKAANIIFAKALAQKLKDHNIDNVTTYSLHPGVINTEISRHFDQTAWSGASWVFNNILGWFIKSPRCGAQTTIYCAVDEACAKESGLYYCDCAVKPPSRFCQDEKVITSFWDITMKELKVNNYDPFGDMDPTKEVFTLNI